MLSLVLTLLVTPVAYTLLDDAAGIAARLRARYFIRRPSSARDVARPALAGGANGEGGERSGPAARGSRQPDAKDGDGVGTLAE
jgi:hypothetical protein